MSNKQRVFDTIEQLNYEYNLNLSVPNDIPEGCNVIGWEFESGDDVNFYKEGEGLLFFSHYFKEWKNSESATIEQEVSYDISKDYNYVYLRLQQKDVFTPDCLVGVETNKGFITYVAAVGTYNGAKYYAYTTEIEHSLVDVHKLKFFISDYSDDVVSFKEYVELFYEG